MKLQGRNLSIRLRGEDVKLLHSELRQLGLGVPAEESDDTLFGPATEALVKAFQTRQGQRPTGIVDATTAAAINREVDRLAAATTVLQLVVRGRVTADDGSAAAGIAVTAFDKDMRSEWALGSATTDRLGRYEIRYDATQFRRAEKQSADLAVRALDPEGAVLAASPILFNAGPVASVDLRIDLSAGRPAEFGRHVTAIAPLREAVPVADLNEADIDFLAGETGIDRLHLAFLATAHQHAAATRIVPEAWYGLLRQGLPSALAALLLQPPAALREALTAAIDARIISEAQRAQLDATTAAFARVRADRLVRGADAAAPPVRILAAAGLTADQQDAVLDMWLGRDSDAGFWTALHASPLAAQAPPLKAALDLALVTGNNAPLTEALGKSNVRNVQALAALSEADLKRLVLGSPETMASIAAAGEAQTDDAKASRLAAGVLGLARARHPSAFLAAARQRSDKPLDRDVARVLANAPEFELRDADLARFLADNPRALDGVVNPDQTRAELHRAQRVLRLAPEAAHAQALMDAGMDSAFAVAGLSAAAFDARFSAVLGGSTQARIYHARAQRIADTVLAIAGAAHPSLSAVNPKAVPQLVDATQGFPNLTTLFGAQDLCACQHCRSVLSPAAYLVDLLQFINPKSGPRPITRLRARRPDIEHIPLSCENTTTALPYIDLLNEILEFYVANGALSTAAAHDTDGASAADLAVTPQFVLDAAYQRLATAVFPSMLPFDRALAAVRRYLEQLGVRRWEIMQAFAAAPADADLESLAISAAERDILIGASAAPLRDYYGLPGNPGGIGSMTAAALAQTLGVSHDDLLLLLKTTHLNPGQTITLTDTDVPPRCNPARMVAAKLTAAFWQRAHRFVRLWRKLAIGIVELDESLVGLGGGDISIALLQRLAQAEALRAQLGLPRKVLLGFWQAAVPTATEERQRREALARALRLGATELDALQQMSGLQPFAAAEPGGLVALTVLAGLIRDSGLTIAQLAHLYQPGHPAGIDSAVPDTALLQLLRATRIALRTLAAEAATGAADPGVLDARRRDVVVQTISESLGLPAETARLLMEDVLRSAADPAQFLMADILGLADLSNEAVTDLGAPALQAVRRGLTRLHKSALLISGLGLSIRETAYVATHGADFGGLSFDAIPVDDAAANPAVFAAWQNLARFAIMSGRMPQRQKTLIDVLEASALPAEANPRDAAIAALLAATQWDATDVAFLAGPAGYNLAAAQDFRDISRLAQLERGIALARRLGVAAQRLMTWASPLPNAAIADDVIAAVRARHEPDTWAAAGKPPRDTLREAQRDALIAWILNHDPAVRARGIADADGLFQYFLIDTQMCACMDTSRIKQAVSSVQLFIQRALMNLEDGVAPDDIDAAQWQWMRNYRIWEANRKVFLFPENWIEPELRDDKSPFFRELEAQLLQDDITFDTAEAAVERYLDRLHEVARLDIRALCVEEPDDDGGEEIVHVFGRTLASPQAYYYRRLIGRRTWTPWEKIDAGIEGDHLLPMVANRRLYLFWLHIEERQDTGTALPHAYIQSMEHWLWQTQLVPKWEDDQREWLRTHAIYETWKAIEAVFKAVSDPPDTDELKKTFFKNAGLLGDDDLPKPEEPAPHRPEEPPFSSPPALSHLEISLAWSECRNGEWSTKRSSTGAVKSLPVMPTVQGLLGISFQGLNDALGFVPKNKEGTALATIFTVCLPSAQEHYLSGSVDVTTGCLLIDVFRRYHREIPLLDIPLVDKSGLTVQGHEPVGQFQVSCGDIADVLADDDVLSDDTDALPFDQLSRPDATGNVAMAFAGTKHQLAFSANGKKRVILGALPRSGAFSVLRDAQHASFRLEPPYQDFIFQDEQRAYLASPTGYAAAVTLTPLPGLPIGAIKDIQVPLVSAVQTKPLLVSKSSSAGGGTRPFSNKPAAMQHLAAPTQLKTTAHAFPAVSKRTSSALLEHVPAGALADLLNLKGLRFQSLVHPHVCAFKEALTRDGIPGLLARSVQSLDGDPGPKSNAFARWYEPTSEVGTPWPREHVDFGRGASALYNWELFFHVPMLVAESLMRNQRFEEAMHWFHFVFDPTISRMGSGPGRFWNCLPFFTNTDPERDSIRELLLALAGKKPGWQAFADQIEEWRRNPFNPHLIARLRITAYQKYVVMTYIDNLVAWGDQLFRRDTIETINQATLLYVLASEILGPRPLAIPPAEQPTVKTYSQLAGDLDAFGNALAEAEHYIPYSNQIAPPAKAPRPGILTRSPGLGKNRVPARPPTFATVTGLYFCPPRNDDLLARWDTVADRLFKIRHCMNIEGVVRALPLFEPPIDPALLVRATAAGLDLDSVLDDLYAGLPHYRFATLAQKASELCSEARGLGAGLLAALEKRDAEDLALVRSGHERAVLELMEQVRSAQHEEAMRIREALSASRDVTLARYAHYQRMLGQESTGELREVALSGQAAISQDRGVPMIEHEVKELSSLDAANDIQRNAAGFEMAANVAHLIGEMSAAPWGVGILINIGASLSAFASYYRMQAANLNYDATLSGKVAQAVLRAADWTLQNNLAVREIKAIEKQLLAADIRIAIAEAELNSHRKQIENARQVEESLRDKFTSKELYNWLVAQASSLYFQAYQLAYDVARRAERAWRYEIGAADSSFIRFGYWESLKKGLLAGERLQHDLKRMEAAYLEQNRRELEITRHVSLAQLDGLAFVALRETGQCIIRLPEALFDMDYPGHYFRRLKNVGVTIPCVVGPYTSVNATLTLLKSEIRIDANAQGSYPKDDNADDARFRASFAPAQSIATSQAQNDSGVFELNFRDDRYLPFEGAGAISEWRLELPKDCNAFDFSTISDVILHVRYTARDGGAALAQKARDATLNVPSQEGLQRLFSVRNEFSNDWHRFLHPAAAAATLHTLVLDIGRERFPFILRHKAITITRLTLYLKPGDTVDTSGAAVPFSIGHRDSANPNSPVQPLGVDSPTFAPMGAPWGNLLMCELANIAIDMPRSLVLDIAVADLAPLMPDGAVTDLLVVAEYSAGNP